MTHLSMMRLSSERNGCCMLGAQTAGQSGEVYLGPTISILEQPHAALLALMATACAIVGWRWCTVCILRSHQAFTHVLLEPGRLRVLVEPVLPRLGAEAAQVVGQPPGRARFTAVAECCSIQHELHHIQPLQRLRNTLQDSDASAAMPCCDCITCISRQLRQAWTIPLSSGKELVNPGTVKWIHHLRTEFW